MPYRSLREFIAKLEHEGELRRVTSEVDWNLEIGALSRRVMDLKGPALIFENIKGYPEGCRILANMLTATKPITQGRFSLAIEMPKDTSTLRLIDEFTERVKKPIKPKTVKTGPCKENIHTGEEIDLLEFPVPFIHGCDGGRYIGTWHIDVTKDPDSDWVNWGMYRHMVHGKKTMGHAAAPYYSHAMMHALKYAKIGQDTPIAVAIGTEPVSSIVAGTPFPPYVTEADMAGALRGEPVELVKCETLDLYVPATSEIVIEGVIKTHEERAEGPFGEYMGYCSGGSSPCPVIHVTCITHRNDPILTMSNLGKPWDEADVVSSISYSAGLGAGLKARGFTFRSLYVPPPHTSVIISTKSKYLGFVHDLSAAIWSSVDRPGLSKLYIFVVGEDVDVTNMEEVFWCLASRMHPVKGIHIEKGTSPPFGVPFLTPQEIKAGCTSGRALFNATLPATRPKEQASIIIDFEHAWPPEVREKVLSKWKEYGLE